MLHLLAGVLAAVSVLVAPTAGPAVAPSETGALFAGVVSGDNYDGPASTSTATTTPLVDLAKRSNLELASEFRHVYDGSANFVATNGPVGPNAVFRGLAAGDDPAMGLTARSPGIGNTPASHVAGAQQTQWISTTRSQQIAQDVFGKYGVVEIDLSKVPSAVADVSGGIPGLPPNAMLSNWARKYQEVLVQDWIPPEAIVRFLG